MESESSSYPELRFFSELAEIGDLRNRLPHWRQDSATCFLTFRTGDSIPKDILTQWRDDREAWLLAHPKPWSGESEMEYHKQFSARIDRWMDEGHGLCVLGNPLNARMVSDTLERCDHSRYLLHAWVIMPNHVHVLVSPAGGEALSSIIAGWKRFSATRIHKAGEVSGSFWQKDYFDRLIRDWDHFMNVARYIRRNPVKAGLAEGRFMLYEAPWVKRLLASPQGAAMHDRRSP